MYRCSNPFWEENDTVCNPTISLSFLDKAHKDLWDPKWRHSFGDRARKASWGWRRTCWKEMEENKETRNCFTILTLPLSLLGAGGGQVGIRECELHALRHPPSIMCSHDQKGWDPSCRLISGDSQRQLDPIESSAGDANGQPKFPWEAHVLRDASGSIGSSQSSYFQTESVFSTTDTKTCCKVCELCSLNLTSFSYPVCSPRLS